MTIAARAGRSPLIVVSVGLLLVCFVLITLTSSLEKSPTSDESFHLMAGYSYLRWGDFRINPEHPPLAKALAALPLLFLKVDDGSLTRKERDLVQTDRIYGWRLANQWLFLKNPAETFFFYAKLPMIALSAVLGIFVFLWARDIYGYTAAFAALTLYLFDPNIIAHSPIVHTDVPFALMFFASTYFYWRTLRKTTWFNWFMTILLFSLSVITKFTSVAILPIWAVLGGLRIVSPMPLQLRMFSKPQTTSGRWAKTGSLTLLFVSAIALGYVALWSAYGFRYRAAPTQIGEFAGDRPNESPLLTKLIQSNRNNQLFPEAWVSGIAHASSFSERASYLVGEISDQGFGYYFPIAFAVKTPLPILILLLITLRMALINNKHRYDERFLLIPLILFFALAVYSRMNIGLRHILAIYPFLFVWLGGTVTALWDSRRYWKQCVVVLLGLWFIWSCARAYPDYLAFFNETIAPRSRHETLVDSNLDWGQDLKGLKKWMNEQGVASIQLAYFGTAEPQYYGIQYMSKPGTFSAILAQPTNSENLAVSPYIAVSATHLSGVYLRPRNPYAHFLNEEPIANIGGSILIFRDNR